VRGAASSNANARAHAVQPGLVFFYHASSGRCRRVEGFLAQVLQRRRNHRIFKLYRVDAEQRPDLVERFGVTSTPSFAVLEGRKVRATLEQPGGCREIEAFLSPWLRQPESARQSG
jgi:thioredoxin-like negative regulator of GroEL